MKLHTANTTGLNIITAYGEDYIAINHQRFDGNVIVLPEETHAAWTSANVSTLQENDMARLLTLGCEIILLGTGSRLCFPERSLLRPFPAAGIGIEIMDLQAACRTYNILATEGRKVAAALLFD